MTEDQKKLVALKPQLTQLLAEMKAGDWDKAQQTFDLLDTDENAEVETEFEMSCGIMGDMDALLFYVESDWKSEEAPIHVEDALKAIAAIEAA